MTASDYFTPARERELRAFFAALPEVVPRAPIHLYIQVADRIRAQIDAGEITSRLPSAAQLARRYGVSRGTTRHALRQLAADGLAVYVPGTGHVVASDNGPAGDGNRADARR